MQPIMKIKQGILAGITAIVLLGFQGCGKECDPQCENGVCNLNTGQCDCLEGYKGEDCSTKLSEMYLGTFSVNQDCGVSGQAAYTITISESSSPNLIKISNLYQTSDDVVGTIDNDNPTSFTIMNQSFPVYGDSVSGTGSVSGGGASVTRADRISITYIYRESGAQEQCNATLDRL